MNNSLEMSTSRPVHAPAPLLYGGAVSLTSASNVSIQIRGTHFEGNFLGFSNSRAQLVAGSAISLVLRNPSSTVVISESSFVTNGGNAGEDAREGDGANGDCKGGAVYILYASSFPAACSSPDL